MKTLEDVSYEADRKLSELKKIWLDYPTDIDQSAYNAVNHLIDAIQNLLYIIRKQGKI